MTSLVCVLLLLGARLCSAQLQFFDLGTTPTVKTFTLPPADDTVSLPIMLQEEFPFGAVECRTVYVRYTSSRARARGKLDHALSPIPGVHQWSHLLRSLFFLLLPQRIPCPRRSSLRGSVLERRGHASGREGTVRGTSRGRGGFTRPVRHC